MRAVGAVLTLWLVACTAPDIVPRQPDAGRPRDGGGVRDTGPTDAGEPRDAGGVDGGPACTRPPETVPGVGEACAARAVPPRPRGCPEDSEARTVERALRGMRLRPVEGVFDLDRHCTTASGTAASCLSAPGPIGDLDLGVDNAWATDVTRDLLFVDPSFESLLLARQESGFGTPVLRIEGWNGLPDDPQVTVTLVVAVRTADGEPPRWDGTDVYAPSDRWFDETGRPLIRSTDGYVTGGLAVAELPDRLPMYLPLHEDADYPMILNEAHIVSTIAPDGSITDALILGRWAVSDALLALEALALCPDATDPAERMMRMLGETAVTRAADVRLDRDEDGGEPLLECNAISVQIGWARSAPATFVDPVPPLGSSSRCD